jgi:anti-anti-sigma factor
MEARGDALLVRAGGELTLPALASLERAVSEESGVARRVVIDLAGVRHVDYRGVRVLGRLEGALRREGGGLALCRPSRYVLAILRLGAAHGILEIFDREADALAAVA